MLPGAVGFRFAFFAASSGTSGTLVQEGFNSSVQVFFEGVAFYGPFAFYRGRQDNWNIMDCSVATRY